MADTNPPPSLEEQIDQWRSFVRRRQAIHTVDVAELEDHLREQIKGLTDAGLASDEAFLVAVKRMGNLDALSREFAREHSGRLWRQLVVVSTESDERRTWAKTDGALAFGLAVLAALAMKAPALFGIQITDGGSFYPRNASLFVLPCLTAYFVWKRRIAANTVACLAGAFVAAAIFANLAGFGRAPHFDALTALHLPIALSLAVGVAYAGGRWSQTNGRMDFIRFSGEIFIY